MKQLYTVVIMGMMSKKQARMVANVAQAVSPSNEVDVYEGGLKTDSADAHVIKPKPVEVQRF